MKTKLLFSAVCAAAFMGNSAIADDKVHADLSAWDSDSDKIVTQEEWADYMEKESLFDRIDKNNNGTFDAEEAAEGVLDYDLSMDIDAGGTISREEFVVGLYNHYDENDDDKLDDAEFDTFASVEESPLWMDESESSDN
ncbi:MAG TPA: hypothetical protein VGE69_02250 [Pseudomonadales bacterium]